MHMIFIYSQSLTKQNSCKNKGFPFHSFLYPGSLPSGPSVLACDQKCEELAVCVQQTKKIKEIFSAPCKIFT